MTYRPRVCGVWPALSGCGRGGSVDRPTCTVSLSGRGLTGRQPRVTRLGRNRGPTRSTELIVEEDDQERHDVKSRYPDLPIFDLRQPHHQQQPAKTSHRREGIGDAAEGQQDNVPPWSRPPRRSASWRRPVPRAPRYPRWSTLRSAKPGRLPDFWRIGQFRAMQQRTTASRSHRGGGGSSVITTCGCLRRITARCPSSCCSARDGLQLAVDPGPRTGGGRKLVLLDE